MIEERVHRLLHVDGVRSDACGLCLASELEAKALRSLDEVRERLDEGRSYVYDGKIARRSYRVLDLVEQVREGAVAISVVSRDSVGVSYRIREVASA